MFEEVQKYGYLYQTVAVHLIIEKFGPEYSVCNRNAYSIRKDMLRAFKKGLEREGGLVAARARLAD